MTRKRSISQHVPVAKLRQLQRDAEEERERLMRKDQQVKNEQTGFGLLRYRSRKESKEGSVERKESKGKGKDKEVERKSWDDETARDLRERTDSVITSVVDGRRDALGRRESTMNGEPRQRRISSDNISPPRQMAPQYQNSRRERPPYVRKRSTSIDSVLNAAARTSEYYGYGARPLVEQPAYSYSSYPNGANTWSASHAPPRYTPVPVSSLTSSRSMSRQPGYTPMTAGEFRSRRLSTGSRGMERSVSQAPLPAPERPPIGGSNSSPPAVTRSTSTKAGAGSGYTSFSISTGQVNGNGVPHGAAFVPGNGSATTDTNAAARRVIPAPNMDWMKFTDPAPSSTFVASYSNGTQSAYGPPRSSYYTNTGFSSADYWNSYARGVPPVAGREN
ncbi:hypothetical protein DACRYDRAFT_23472 [Dacryopinax primogenitus]|uniref:Uncharacterized protein n=1 Tax=Dacryopinax primogenitus (strain DJM 731) TaxID=1858805 RepID=M5G216_DACPD|nr:uncharacterized protein DACRYDRAFT_23472 [Dacryopinax primogenitus]EJT99931.1 hypothetical protein DACRYDRAFT_23472 [Dacryopinax primogenitus]